MFLRKIIGDPDIAIDLGTANTRLSTPNHQEFLEEPSVVQYRIKTVDQQEVGVQVLPLRGGVVADVDAAASLLKPKFERMKKFGLLKPRVLACIPTDATDSERYALIKAVHLSGGSSVHVVPEPLAAAVGSGVNVSERYAQMLVDIGDGVTDIAVIRSCELIFTRAVRKACSDLRENIRKAILERHKMNITRTEAEKVTRELGASTSFSEYWIQVAGRCRLKNVEMNATVSTSFLADAMHPVYEMILRTISDFLYELPDDVSSEVIESGIYLTGGGASLNGLAAQIQERTSIQTSIVKDPLRAVILGASMMRDMAAKTDLWV